jgi:rsbT co-antagonist protein RsbR
MASYTLESVLQDDFQDILDAWIRAQLSEGVQRRDLLSEGEVRDHARKLLGALSEAVQNAPLEGNFDLSDEIWSTTKDLLAAIARERVERGFTPSEMGRFLISLKPPIYEALRARISEPDTLTEAIWTTTRILDFLGLYTADVFLEERDAVIRRQRAEMEELSAPVVQIWDKVVALPLIGTLDSERAQTVMENLLQSIVERDAEVVIIDITGVPTVDTLVAQHLLKTAAATRLMGAECVISGISPRIAQTIVHLGVELPNVTTRGDLQDALAYALRRVGFSLREREGSRDDR